MQTETKLTQNNQNANTQINENEFAKEVHRWIIESLSNLRQSLRKLDIDTLKELRDNLIEIENVITEIEGILSGDIRKVTMHFEYFVTTTNVIALYGVYSGEYYGEVNAVQISAKELEQILRRPETIANAVKALTNAVDRLVLKLKHVVDDIIDEKDPDP